MIITGAQVYTHDEILQRATVITRKEIIESIVTDQTVTHSDTFVFPNNFHLMPGFIDVHVHGLAGCDVMDADVSSLESMSRTLAQEGTTSFLATTMTSSIAHIEKTLLAIASYSNCTGASLLGVHLEGPFISKAYAGAQRVEHAIFPDINLFNRWQTLSGNAIRLVTVAPELPDAIQFIEAVSRTGVVVSIGHTSANVDETLLAIEAGCRHGTHVFNAMKGLHHRSPGTVTPLLLNENVSVEIILDNLHLHPMVVDLVYRLKGAKGIMLVTDAMRAKCLIDGEYDLGGQAVTVCEGAARLANGRLAGSVLHFPDALKNMLNATGCHLHDVMHMLSSTPAKQLNVFDQRGSIVPGKLADFVVLDDMLRVVMTVCRGEVVYSSKTIDKYRTVSV